MKLSDALLGGAAVLLGAATFAYVQSFPKMPDGTPGPSLFPQILGVLLVIFGVAVVVQSVRPHTGENEHFERNAVIKAGLVLVGIAVYIGLVQRLGFLITATLVTGSLMLVLGVKLRVALPTTILLVIGSVMLFERILRVPLPVGLLGV